MKERLNDANALTNNLEQSKLKEKATRVANIRMEGKDSQEPREKNYPPEVKKEVVRAVLSNGRKPEEISPDERVAIEAVVKVSDNISPDDFVKGKGFWKNKDGNAPVVVTGYLGEIDNRPYVSIEGSSDGIPLSEIVYEEEPEEGSEQPDQIQPGGDGNGGNDGNGEEPPAPPSGEDSGENEEEDRLEKINPEDYKEAGMEEIIREIKETGTFDPDLLTPEAFGDARREIARALRENRIDREKAEMLRDQLKVVQEDLEKKVLRKKIEEKNHLVDALRDRGIDREDEERGRAEREEDMRPRKRASEDIRRRFVEVAGGEKEADQAVREFEEGLGGGVLDYSVTDAIVERINSGDISLEDAKNRIEDLNKYVEKLSNYLEGGEENSDLLKYRAQIISAREAETIEEVRRAANNLKESLRDHYSRPEMAQINEAGIRSIDDLAHLIMHSEEDKWRTGGKYELIRKDKEGNEEFVPEHFLEWVRSRINYYHDQNADSQIKLFQQISIPTTYRSISIAEIIDTARYMMKKEDRIGSITTRDGRTIEGIVPNYVTSKEMDNLKDNMLMEVWLFNENHDADTNYRLAMGREDDANKALAQIHYNNVFTKDRGRMLRILKLASAHMDRGEEGEKKAFDQMLEKGHTGQEQGAVGRLIRRSILAYYYIGDIEGEIKDGDGNVVSKQGMFESVMNSGSGGEGMRGFYMSLIEQSFNEEIEEMKELKRKKAIEDGIFNPSDEMLGISIFSGEDQESFKQILRNKGINITDEELFNGVLDDVDKLNLLARKAIKFRFFNKYAVDEKGEVQRDEQGRPIVDDRRRFTEWANIRDKDIVNLSALNIYATNKIDQLIIDLTRKAIQAGVARAEGMPEDEKIDIQYADNWAFSFTYWSGISALNDTSAIGFDKYSNVVHTAAYRNRQAQGRGPAGIDQTIFGIQKLNLIFWQALKTKREGIDQDFGTPLIESLQGGEGENVNLSRLEDFDFEGNAQRQHYTETISNGFKLTAFLVDNYGIDFSQFLKRSTDYLNFGKASWDYKKANEVLNDGLWHDLRYCFDQPNYNWEKKIRTWRLMPEKDEKPGEITKDKKVPKLKATFGTWTIRELMFSDEVNSMGMYERKEIREVQSPEKAVSRNVFSWLVAKELFWHRQWRGGQQRWGLSEVELVKDYFREWAFGVHEEEINGRTTVVPNTSFFNEEEMDTITKVGAVGFWRLFLQELGWSSMLGILEGTASGGKTFAKNALAA